LKKSSRCPPRVTAGQLQAEDLSRLSKLLELLLTLLQMIEQPKLKLRQLRWCGRALKNEEK
jgi:hypothetical protein